MTEITKLTSVADIVKACPTARRVFDKYGLKGCGGEHGPTEALEFFAAVHNVDVDALVRELNAEMRNPSKQEHVYQESLGDFIYRRFFKAGIAIVLSVGALWGAINLLQIAQGGTFLQVHLVPAIQAHAHAMIFGWMGLFVMGFAYQSFPRFKYVTLWRADLANLTLYLMLIGIASRVAAEMLQPMPVGVGLGILAAATELAAITMFIIIILKTAQQSVEPHQIYEKFIFGAFFWFFIQAIVSDVLFFAKVTAARRGATGNAHRADRRPAAGYPVAGFWRADHRRSQPALCAGGLWFGQTAARSPDADLLADQRLSDSRCRKLRAALLHREYLFLHRTRVGVHPDGDVGGVAGHATSCVRPNQRDRPQSEVHPRRLRVAAFLHGHAALLPGLWRR